MTPVTALTDKERRKVEARSDVVLSDATVRRHFDVAAFTGLQLEGISKAIVAAYVLGAEHALSLDAMQRGRQ